VGRYLSNVPQFNTRLWLYYRVTEREVMSLRGINADADVRPYSALKAVPRHRIYILAFRICPICILSAIVRVICVDNMHAAWNKVKVEQFDNRLGPITAVRLVGVHQCGKRVIKEYLARVQNLEVTRRGGESLRRLGKSGRVGGDRGSMHLREGSQIA
jgi:hypothetical protein